MDAKQLEATLRTIDFSNRFEEKLKNHMDNVLLAGLVRQNSQDDESARLDLLEVLSTFYEYYKKVLMLFYPLIKSERVEEPKDPKTKRKLEFKEKILTDFKQAFINHLKFSILDQIDYSGLFDSFISIQFPLWQRQVDQAGFDLSLQDSENLDFIRRLIQDSGHLPDMDIESDNSHKAFDASVDSFDLDLAPTDQHAQRP